MKMDDASRICEEDNVDNQEYRPRDDQDEQAQMSGMPDTQRDQSESYERQNSPRGWSPGQQAQGAADDSEDSMRGEQPEERDQRQASDDQQAMDDNYGKDITSGQWKNQSDQDY